MEHSPVNSIFQKFFKKLNFLFLILITWSLILGIKSDNKIITGFQILKLIEFFLLFQYLIFRISPLLFKTLTQLDHLTKNKCSTWNKSNFNQFIILILLLINSIALLLTVSKSAILASLFGIIIIFRKKMFHVEHFKLKILSIIVLIFTLISFLSIDWHSLLFKSLIERFILINVPYGTFIPNIFSGNGLNQTILNVSKIPGIETWQIQPIHNIVIIILTDLGIIGLLIFIGLSILIYRFIKNNKCSTWNIQNKKIINVPRGTSSIIKDITILFLILGLINSIIAILQFLLQKSLGLNWLFESYLTPSLPGVAKIIAGGEKYIRGYGLFPHPNILGSFLLTQIFMLIYLINIIPINLVGNKKPFYLGAAIIYNKLKISPANIYILTKNILTIIFLSFLFISLFDHYFWDIQQGKVLFVLIIGILIGICNDISK